MFYMRYLTSVLFLFLGILPLVSFGQEVHTIKAIGDLPFSNQFQVRVNGQVATVEKLEKFDVPIHYTRIAYGGDKPVTIEIEINNPIEYYSISPKRKQLKGLVKDHILSFSLDGPTYLLVKINRMEELFILVDKMQDYKSDTFTGSLTDIMDYQVDNTGKSIETAKLQKAIDDVSRMNGVLYFPAGIYKTGELKMRSNMSVILSEGALLLGSEDVKDYADKSLIRLDNVSNFRLLGYGVIDGSGWSGLRNNGGTGFHLLYASDCNDILIDGVMLRDPSFWNTRVYRSKNFHLKNIKIFNNRPYKNWTNTDGIDFDSSVDCSVTHAVIHAGDDNLVVKGLDKERLFISENILFDDVLTVGNSAATKIGTETGLYLYDEIQKKASKCVNDYFDKRSLSDNAIYAVYRDSDNGLWVGTYFGGINYMSINENRYIESYYPIATKTSLKGRVVREIRSDSMGNLWIGTEDAGLNYFNSQEKSIIPVSAHLEHYNVHGLCVIDDELYVGVYSGGLNIYNLNTGAVKRYYISDERYNVQNSIYAIYQDTKGRIWICTQGGLYWFSPKEGTFTRINGFSNMYVHNICEDRHGNIWLASVGGGLVCYTFDSKRVDFISEIQRQTGHWINKVVDVYEDKDGWLWMGTIGYGLLCYNPDDKQFSHYTIEDGFPDYTAFSPIQDDFGDIWVGTNRGLVRLNPLSGNIRVFTKSEGLISNQFNYNSAYKDSRGKLYFGTIGGLVVIDPLNIKDDLSFPTVYLTGFQINNKEVIPRADSPLKHSIIHTNELELEYDQNFISFDFAVLKYAATTNDACCVRLEGLDKDWSYTDVQRISYSDLRPGKYILQIKSKNSVGQWQEARSLTIQIHSPWWKSVWAYTIYCILILALIVLLMSYNQQKVNKKHQKLMQELEHEKERESYHAKLEFITNIAHEIKTPLTLIKTPLEYIMRNKSLDKNTQETLDIMMRNTERLLSLTYQLLDFQRVETKRVQLNFERTDINLLLKSIYRRFKLPSEQHEREFSLLLPEDSLFADVDLEAFTKIISNLFTNASKYSLSEIKVELTTVANNSFCVIVENDGELIEPTMREAIFEPFVQVSSQGPISSGRGLGLPLARSLAQLHGGSLILDTTCIERNRFVLNLPCFHQIRTDDIELKDEESISITNVKFSEKPAMLIVEDNLEMQDFISKRLMDKYDVYRAADGLEALKVLKEFDIDIVVSDIMMPNMDGMELLKNIKETVEYSHIPVILLSAKSDLESRINGLELGADAYIEKPFSLEYLMAQIQNLLMNRKSIKELFYKRPFIEANVVALTKTDELFLKKMNEIIEKNIDNTQFSVDVLTEKMNMSRSSLHRKIKGVTDLTPNDYIRLQRLKRAASLLCESGYRVNEIASLTGFTSASYFTKCFHQHFGMLPKEFIKQSGSSNNLTE